MTVYERDGLNSGSVRESGSEHLGGRSVDSLFFFGRPLGGLITWWVVTRERRLAGCRVNTAQLDSGEGAGVPRQANKTELPAGSARPGRSGTGNAHWEC